MSQLVAVPTHSGGSSDLQQQIRARIESLSYLPTTVAVAMKFVELGKDPQADPSDYAKVISADSSLSSKILALANSSWFGVRNKVATIRAAVNLLGLSTVRSLAISYCMTGLHNELGLTSDESHIFWEASLCKAVAAKQYLSMHAEHLANEGFLVGMFQDALAFVKGELFASVLAPGAYEMGDVKKMDDVLKQARQVGRDAVAD